MSNTLQYSCLENPLSDREGWQDTVYRVAKSWTGQKRPSMHKYNIIFFFSFFGLSQLCPSESWAWRWCSCLAWGDPGGPKCAGTQTVSLVGVTALLVSFFPLQLLFSLCVFFMYLYLTLHIYSFFLFFLSLPLNIYVSFILIAVFSNWHIAFILFSSFCFN